MSDFTPHPIPDGIVEQSGKLYREDAKGHLVPLDMVKPQDELQDETVRTIMGYAIALSAQMARFKAHTFDDIGALEAILAQEYEVALGGRKGNMTLMSYDGLMKVQVQVADRVDFGPELQIAKTLIDECLNEWAADARPEIRAIVTRAFNTDREGQVNRAELFMLKRLRIDEPRWQRAMGAIDDAMRVVGTKTYVRCYRRDRRDGPWQPVTLDMAKV